MTDMFVLRDSRVRYFLLKMPQFALNRSPSGTHPVRATKRDGSRKPRRTRG